MRTRDYMNTKNWPGKTLAAVAAFLLMAGCGGGGSGGVSAVSYTLPSVASSPVAINSSTVANNVAVDAMNSGGDTLNAGGGGVVGVVTSGGTTTVQQPLFGAINMANKLIVDSRTGGQSAAGITQTLSCLSSGSVTETIDASNNILFQYTNCDNGSGFVANGSIAATNVSGSGTSSSFNISMTYSYNLTFVDTGTSASIAEMGSFDVNIVGTVGSTLTTTITNGEMGITTSLGSLVLTNLTENRSCDSFDSSTYICAGTLTVYGSYDVASEHTGFSLNVSVTSGQPLVFSRYPTAYALCPYSGTLNITGSGGSYLTIVIDNDEIGTMNATAPAWDYSFSWNDGSGGTGSGTGTWSGFGYL